MHQLATKDVEVLPAETVKVLDRAAKKINSLHGKTVQNIIAIGEELNRIKTEELPPGAWLDWVRKELPFSRYTAFRYMAVAEAFGSKCCSLQHFTLEALYVLSSDKCPEEATEEALKLAEFGEKVNKEVAKGLQEKHSLQPDEPCDSSANATPSALEWDADLFTDDVLAVYMKWSQVASGSPKLRSEFAETFEDLAAQARNWAMETIK